MSQKSKKVIVIGNENDYNLASTINKALEETFDVNIITIDDAIQNDLISKNDIDFKLLIKDHIEPPKEN